jgi:hypothetical protein
MSDLELIALAGWLVLLAIGLWLMFSPSGKTDGAEQRVEPAFPAQDSSPESSVNFRIIRPENGGRGVEALSVERTGEAGVDRQYRQAGEMVQAGNDGEGVDAKSDHDELGLEAMARVESATQRRLDSGSANRPGGAQSYAEGDQRATGSADIIASLRPILDPRAVADVITQKMPLGSLVADCELLSSFFLRKHVTPDDIEAEAPASESVEVAPLSFFGDYHHRYSNAVSDVLKNMDPDVAQRYVQDRHFPHGYVVHFFDEALVVTLYVKPGHPEYLVISPVDSDYEEFFGSLLSSSRITELFVGATGGEDSELRLYRELDRILERLRS